MRKKILIVDDQEEILEILQLYIEGSFDDVETIVASGGYEAISILESEKISSIICDFRMPEGDGSLVFDFNEKNLKIPFCWHSGTYLNDIKENARLNKKYTFHLNKPTTEEEVCRVLNSMMALNAEVSNLRKIRIPILKKIPQLEIDLYIKLNESKKILINAERDMLPLDKFNELESKGVEFLYIKKEDFENISNYYWKQFDEKLKNIKNIEDVYFVIDDYVKSVQQDLSDQGIDVKLFQAGLKCANTCLKNLNKDEAIKALMSGKIDRSNYIGNHSLLTVQIASLFIEDIDLLELIAQAAIFHDLALSNERLAKITPFGPEFDGLTPQEKEIVKNHGAKIVEILKDSEFLPEIKDIIINHHRKISDNSWINNCGIIEIAFIVSHEISHLLSIGNLEDVKDWLLENKQYFDNSTYKEFYSRVLKIFKI